ncbi:MAG: hypothetical protein Q4E46_01160 [Candidatus Saccharibacteria bacterium]|nr:hypothetical protein [Candidatus Saccharibacteria bacterium]
MKKKNSSSKCFAIWAIIINLLAIFGLFIFMFSPVVELWLNLVCILAITTVALVSDLLFFKRVLVEKSHHAASLVLTVGALASIVAKFGIAELVGYVMVHSSHSLLLDASVTLLSAIVAGVVVDSYLMNIFKAAKGKKTLLSITLALWLPTALVVVASFLAPLWVHGTYFDSHISAETIATISAFIVVPLIEVFLVTRKFVRSK